MNYSNSSSIRTKKIVLVVASIAVFFEALDIAIINLAMPPIQDQFHLPNDQVQWLQTLYVLLYGGFLIIGGKLADVVGRKKIFLAGGLLFLITSFGAGMSFTFTMLAVFRAVQGIAAALILPSALSIITNTFTEPKERGKAIGIFSGFAAIGSGSGLSVGGLIATYFGWQAVFFINVPIIAITLFFALKYIPEEESSPSRKMPDFISGIFVAVLFLAASYLMHLSGDIENNIIPVVALTFSIAVVIRWLVYRMRAQDEPFIDFSILSSTGTVTGAIAMILLGAIFTGFLFVASIMMQNNMNYEAGYAGLMLFPFSIMSALTAKFFIPVLLKRLSIVQGAITGMLIMLSGTLSLLISMSLDYNLGWLLLAFACVSGLGMAICFTTLTVISVEGIPVEQHGLASSVSSTAYFFGGGLGLSMLSAVMGSEGEHHHMNRFPLFMLVGYAMIGAAVLMAWYFFGKRKTTNTDVQTG